MKNIKPLIIILLAFVVAMPVIALAQTTNVSGKAVQVAPQAIQAAPTETKSVPVSNTATTQVTPAETKSVSTSNTTINNKCGVNSFSVSNECGVGAFKNSYVQCYDGYTENQGGDSSCKPSSLWQEYAKSVCVNRCANTNTTTKSYVPVPSTDYSGGQNVPITSTKAVPQEIPATTVAPQVISVCYIGNDLMKQYDALLSELRVAQANGDKEKSDAITQRILELKKQITASKERCNTATTKPQPPTTTQSAPTIAPTTATVPMPVKINRCAEVENWGQKISYYEKLKNLSDSDLQKEAAKSRKEINDIVAELIAGLQKVKEQCNLQTATGSVSSASSRAIIAEPVKPVAVQSAQEIDTYYKAKIENISAIQNAPQQVKELQTLKDEKNQMVGDLIKNRNEIEAVEINKIATDINVSKNEMKIDNVTVKATGKKILLNVGDRPISVESAGSNVIIKDKNLEVTTDNVSISDNSLKIGNTEVKISASQAAEKLNIAPTAVQLTTENDQPVYKMEVNESRKLFGFIKINAGKTQTVSADNGNLMSEKHPWYYFLTTK